MDDLFGHGQVEALDQGQFLGHADGGGGAAALTEPRQGLEVVHGPCLQVDDGLVEEGELAVADDAAEAVGVLECPRQGVSEAELGLGAVVLQAALDGEAHGAQGA
ncbi:hypothetical protein D3C86_1267180 [compost metagenome]